MRLYLLTFLFSTILVACAFGAPIPIDSIYQIQYTTDVSGNSPLKDSTVVVGGIVTAISYNHSLVSYFIADRSGGLWHGILARDNTAPAVAIGDSVHFTATVEESGNQTRLSRDTRIALDQTSNVTTVQPVVVTCAGLVEATEGVLVEIHSVHANVSGSTITLGDATGTAAVGAGWTFSSPQNGDSLSYVRGIVTQSGATYAINPRNDLDIGYATNRPPVISNLRNGPLAPTSLESDTITARIVDETVVDSAKVVFRKGQTSIYDSVYMHDDGTNGDFEAGDDVWTGIIPPDTSGAVCYYYIVATDDGGKTALYPTTAPNGLLPSFKRSVPLSDIYNHFSERYASMPVITVSGVVNFLEAYNVTSGSRITAYLQDKSETVLPNGHIVRYGLNLSGSGDTTVWRHVRRGNVISISGQIENYQGTLELYLTSGDATVDSGLTPAPMPEPIRLKTGDRYYQADLLRTDTPALYGGGTWCEFTGYISSVAENVGGGTNINMDDGSGPTTIRVWDSMPVHYLPTLIDGQYHMRDLVNKIVTIKGVSSSYNGDFQILGGNAEDFTIPGSDATPTSEISIAVPNKAFAPEIGQTLRISYKAPSAGSVKLRIFDLRGRLIRTFVDKNNGGPNSVTWDGRNDLKELVPMGTYILHLESVQNGTTTSKTKPIVVGAKL